MKRLCIYLTYDKQNIVDKYIGYMLKELKTCVDFLVVICNKLNINKGKYILEKYANEIYYRENIGLDAGGFKDALCLFIGWDKVLLYDELVLANDSFFGPFCPMKQIFSDMNEQNVDFWGLSKYGKHATEANKIYPEHLQSYYIVVRTKMLHDLTFRKYWEDMPYYNTYREVVMKNEMFFTDYFAKHGYTYKSYSDMEPNDSLILANNFNQFQFIPYELIKKRNFPFLKKKSLLGTSLYYQTQENARLAIDYIDKNTDYDINLIWDNILRIFDISDLQRSLHLKYIITTEEDHTINKKAIIVIVIANYEKSVEMVFEYLDRLHQDYKIKIYSYNKNLKNIYEKKGYWCCYTTHIKLFDNIFKDCMDSEYVCIIHDIDITGDIEPSYVGKSCFFNVWDNLLKDKKYVIKLLNSFEKEPRLGLLTPPEINFGRAFSKLGCWDSNEFEIAFNGATAMGLECPISYEKYPLTISDNLWIRTEILRKVYYNDNYDPVSLQYLWSYIAQDAGYYSGTVESTDYAAMNEIHLQNCSTLILKQIKYQYGEVHNIADLVLYITKGAILNFCMNLKSIYVYGTGTVAKRYHNIFPYITAYIVSDGQPKKGKIRGINVKYLSEIEYESDAGIILCLSEENQKQVIPLLKKKGWNNYFCV